MALTSWASGRQGCFYPRSNPVPIFAFAMHPPIGVAVDDGAFRDVEKFINGHIEEGEVSQIEIVLEKGFTNCSATLAGNENRPPVETS